jgi:hypothetical protein
MAASNAHESLGFNPKRTRAGRVDLEEHRSPAEHVAEKAREGAGRSGIRGDFLERFCPLHQVIDAQPLQHGRKRLFCLLNCRLYDLGQQF